MLEIPEAKTIARQVGKCLTGKVIKDAVAASSPHGFAWYFEDPAEYGPMLRGKTVTGAIAHGGRPEILAGEMRIAFGDGVNARYFEPGQTRPENHQLLIEFEDLSAIVCTVSMYGGIWACADGMMDGDPYHGAAKNKPSPLSDAFDRDYFDALVREGGEKLTAKALLATEQRIPGLGNGVLQDILWIAGIHPKRKIGTLSGAEMDGLYASVKNTLLEMTQKSGRDTERDLFGASGGYVTVMSRKNDGMPCPRCGGDIKRMAYMGGNVYVCENCQRL